MRTTIIILISLLFFRCNRNEQCGVEIPKVNQVSNHPVIDTNGQIGTAYFLNKKDRINSYGISSNEYNSKQKYKLNIFVDANLTIADKYRTAYLSSPDIYDSLDRLVWTYKAPYDSITKTRCYLINCSANPALLQISDGKLIAIQEAQDDNKKWLPIEKFELSGCGNSYSKIEIKQKSLIMIPINKYSGTYKTKCRLKIMSDGQIYYSNEFESAINKKQIGLKDLEFGETYFEREKGY